MRPASRGASISPEFRSAATQFLDGAPEPPAPAPEPSDALLGAMDRAARGAAPNPRVADIVVRYGEMWEYVAQQRAGAAAVAARHRPALRRQLSDEGKRLLGELEPRRQPQQQLVPIRAGRGAALGAAAVAPAPHPQLRGAPAGVRRSYY